MWLAGVGVTFVVCVRLDDVAKRDNWDKIKNSSRSLSIT